MARKSFYMGPSGSAFSRRSLVGGAAAGITAAGLQRAGLTAPRVTQTSTQLARQQATPAADIRPTAQTYPLVQEQVTFRVLVPHYGIDWVNNAFTQWYEERTNVHIEWVVVEDEAAVTQLNLQLASGDYPDIVMGFNWDPFELTSSVVAAYGAQGIFVPINDHLANNTPNLQQYVIPEYPIASQITTMPGGEIYAMPYINDCLHCLYNTQKMWISQAWLDAVGMEMPTTTAEFEQVALAFKATDINGNGQADEIPITAGPGFTLDRYLMNPFQLSSGSPWLYSDAGAVTASYMQDGWRDGLAWLQSLSNQGLISPETFTQDADQLQALGDANRIGVSPGVVAGTFVEQTEGVDGLWADYRMMAPLEGPTGLRQTYCDYDEAHIANVFVVTNKCADPALAVAWADGLYEWEATQRSIIGIPGENWGPAEEGLLGIDGEPARWAPIPQPDDGGATLDNTTTWAQLSPSFRNSKDRLSQAVVNDRALNTEVILYEGCNEQLAPHAIAPEVDLLRPVFSSEQAVRASELETVIIDYVRTNFAQAVVGQIDPVGGWDAYIEQLRALGVDEYIAIRQAAADATSSGS